MFMNEHKLPACELFFMDPRFAFAFILGQSFHLKWSLNGVVSVERFFFPVNKMVAEELFQIRAVIPPLILENV
jgi:hypothetical protein